MAVALPLLYPHLTEHGSTDRCCHLVQTALFGMLLHLMEQHPGDEFKTYRQLFNKLISD